MVLIFINHLRTQYGMDRKPYELRTKNLEYGAKGNETKIIKRKINQWVPDNCPCRICKNYLPNIGFI